MSQYIKNVPDVFRTLCDNFLRQRLKNPSSCDILKFNLRDVIPSFYQIHLLTTFKSGLFGGQYFGVIKSVLPSSFPLFQ